MSTRTKEPRAARHAAHAEAEGRDRRRRALMFAAVVVAVVGAGVWLTTSDLLGQRGRPTSGKAIAVRASMAGFTPRIIEATAGETVQIDFWTTDAAPHLAGGVHTFISEELGLHEELPAESRVSFSFVAPPTPGDYDIYCDTCCGGKDSPTMHGLIRVRA